MADFATITGAIGAISGVISLIVSTKSYCRVRAMKALDLRLELKKAFSNLDVVLSGIEGYFDYVHQSHIRVLAGTGHHQSGEMESFEEEFARDKAKLKSLLGEQPHRESDYNGLTLNELESTKASVHAFYVQLSELRGKYQKLLESDEDSRKEIRQRNA